jgi:hypothetical protein
VTAPLEFWTAKEDAKLLEMAAEPLARRSAQEAQPQPHRLLATCPKIGHQVCKVPSRSSEGGSNVDAGAEDGAAAANEKSPAEAGV